MDICDDYGDEESFTDSFLPNLSELEATINETLGFKPDHISKLIRFFETGEGEIKPEG